MIVKYKGYFSDGNGVEAHTLEEILAINDIKYIFKVNVHQELDNWNRKINLNKFIHIDKEEKPIPIIAGKYKFLDIEGDNQKSRVRVIYKIDGSEETKNIDFPFYWSAYVVEKELIPLAEALSNTISIETYLQIKENSLLHEKILKLESDLAEKINLISQLMIENKTEK
jgi:hypothetical protein